MKIIFLFLASISLSWGIVHEVHQISQALSLHGTDVSEDFKGEPVQARIDSFPSVIVGAIPEALISAVASPHRLPGPDSYQIPESNLLVLCGISLESEMTDKGLVCIFNVADLKIPEEVTLSVHTILELSIKATRETLERYYRGSKSSEQITIKIVGVSEKNAALKAFAQKFRVGN
ncbi:hypothetical protein N9Z02_00500 [Akkermansiaceae bacterium]|nr:hypothetical protein [Akkermansiaceae bacterium]